MITAGILITIIIVLTIFAVKNRKSKPPWITKDELTRLEDIAKRKGEA